MYLHFSFVSAQLIGYKLILLRLFILIFT